jgi:hypothetical protein
MVATTMQIYRLVFFPVSASISRPAERGRALIFVPVAQGSKGLLRNRIDEDFTGSAID